MKNIEIHGVDRQKPIGTEMIIDFQMLNSRREKEYWRCVWQPHPDSSDPRRASGHLEIMDSEEYETGSRIDFVPLIYDNLNEILRLYRTNATVEDFLTAVTWWRAGYEAACQEIFR